MYFKQKNHPSDNTPSSSTMANADTNYLTSSPNESSSLKDHYLLKHPLTKVVLGISLVLLLIMMALLPQTTAKYVEDEKFQEEKSLGIQNPPSQLTPVKMQLFNPSNWMNYLPAWGSRLKEANLAPAMLPNAFTNKELPLIAELHIGNERTQNNVF